MHKDEHSKKQEQKNHNPKMDILLLVYAKLSIN
jgi:hypothetical protein